MEMINFDINQCCSLSEQPEIRFCDKIFEDLIKSLRKGFKNSNISMEGSNICYQRFNKTNSILGIKVINGDDSDYENYLFIGGNTFYSSSGPFSNTYIHSNAKASNKSLILLGYVSEDIIKFFERLEKALFNHNMVDTEISLMLPLEVQKEEKDIKRLFKRFLK